MVTVDDRGCIETANCAAIELLAPPTGQLIGQPIAGFLPALHYALRNEGTREFRTAIECQGRLGNGKPFLARVWFSTYKQGSTRKLAAIIREIGAHPTAA
jgi:nitrogen fixation/metabolism regulation signal transduction histidine kinase